MNQASESSGSPAGAVEDETVFVADQFSSFDMIGLAGLVKTRHVSADDLLNAAISRCEAVNPRINAVALKHYEVARAAIKAGLPEGPLTGAPFLLKNIQDLAGTRTDQSSKLGVREATTDSYITRRYKEAGLVIFGKTNVPEYSLMANTAPVMYGPTRNPWNLRCSVAGSSGGAGAAIASGIVAAAHGTDIAGSIRLPAAYTGTFGLKPSRGRGPCSLMAVQHALTRTVRDSALLLDILKGPAPDELYLAPPLERPLLDEVTRLPGQLRIAVLSDCVFGPEIKPDPVCRDALADAARLCESLGHVVEDAILDIDPGQMMSVLGVIMFGEKGTLIADSAAALGVDLATSVEPATLSMISSGPPPSLQRYIQSRDYLGRLGALFATFFKRYDIILTPMVGLPPPDLDYLSPYETDLGHLMRRHVQQGFNAPIANISGCPMMSVPLAWTSGGLPIGSGFMAGWGQDAILIRLAAQLEHARPWAGRTPST